MICVLPAVVYSRKDQSIIMPNLGQTISYDNTYINEGNVKKIVCKKISDLRDFGIKNTEMETRVNGGLNALPNFRKISVPNILPQTYHTLTFFFTFISTLIHKESSGIAKVADS